MHLILDRDSLRRFDIVSLDAEPGKRMFSYYATRRGDLHRAILVIPDTVLTYHMHHHVEVKTSVVAGTESTTWRGDIGHDHLKIEILRPSTEDTRTAQILSELLDTAPLRRR